MEKTIRGWKIKKYNQWNFEEGAKYSTCPICSKNRKKPKQKCVLLDWNTGIWNCMHCGYKGFIHDIEKRKNNNFPNQKYEYVKPSWKNKTLLSDKITKYFEGRNISQDTLKKAKITTEDNVFFPQDKKNRQAIRFNYLDENELINVKYRDAKKNFKLHEGAKLCPYNVDNIKLSGEALIVEGEIDVLSYMEAGIDFVISAPNGANERNNNLSWLNDYIDYFENKDKVYIAVDNDKAGKALSKELARRIGFEKCYLVNFGDTKDANEYLDKYGQGALRATLKDATEYPIENVKHFENFEDDFWNFVDNGMPGGYITGTTNMDKFFSTYLNQFLWVVGIPSHGKTNLIQQMVIGYNLLYDFPVAMCTIEDNPDKRQLAKNMIGKISGNFPQSSKEKDKYEKAINRFNKFFHFIEFDNGYTLEKILEKTKELVKRFGIKVLVIDPFVKAPLEDEVYDINKNTRNYINKIDMFCRKYSVFIIIAAHTRKLDKKKDGSLPNPTIYDVKGGGEIPDMSPHIITVMRNFDYDYIEVNITKVKFSHLGTNRAEFHLKYNNLNSRLTSVSSPDEYGVVDVNEINWDNKDWLDLDASEMDNSDYNEIKNEKFPEEKFPEFEEDKDNKDDINI